MGYGKRTWASAEKDCQANGGNLAAIHSADENARVAALCKYRYCWIGGLKCGTASASVQSSGWSWSNGCSADYFNFDPDGGQRVGVLNQQALFIRGNGNGHWQFDPQKDDYHYVCEKSTLGGTSGVITR